MFLESKVKKCIWSYNHDLATEQQNDHTIDSKVRMNRKQQTTTHTTVIYTLQHCVDFTLVFTGRYSASISHCSIQQILWGKAVQCLQYLSILNLHSCSSGFLFPHKSLSVSCKLHLLPVPKVKKCCPPPHPRKKAVILLAQERLFGLEFNASIFFTFHMLLISI